MPTYEYACADCGRRFEVTATMEEKARGLMPGCPQCRGKNTIRIFGSIAVHAGKSGSRSVAACGPGSGSGCCPR